MVLEQRRRPWRALFVGASLCLVCAVSAGCETSGFGIRRGNFFITGDGMAEGFQRWREHASPEDRAMIDELMWTKDLQIHIVLAPGKIDPSRSRAGASTLAGSRLSGQVCTFHPQLGLPWARDWHVAYDPVLVEEFEKKYGIPTPVEVFLQHEIIGHILFWVRHPDLLRDYIRAGEPLEDPTEPGALTVENRYRKRIAVPEVPPEWFRHSLP